jgi:hypothetical protein
LVFINIYMWYRSKHGATTDQETRAVYAGHHGLDAGKPGGRYAEASRALGVSENWISIVVNSDVYQQEYRRRHRAMQKQIEAKVMGVMGQALERLSDQLETTDDPRFILRTVDILAGAYIKVDTNRTGGTTQNIQQNAFVVDPETLRRIRALAGPPLSYDVT